MKGAPLRFAVAVIGGWVAGRAYVLWPDAADGPARVQVAGGKPGRMPTVESSPAQPVSDKAMALWQQFLPGEGRGPVAQVSTKVGSTRPPNASQLGPGLRRAGEKQKMLAQGRGEDASSISVLPTVDQQASIALADTATPDPIIAPGAIMEPRSTAQPPSRLRGDAWLIARGGGSGDSLAFGQLGASQAGARLTYTIGSGRRVALSARMSTPLRDSGREAGAGIDWQPTRLPLHVLIEERLPLDGGRARPAAQLIAGVATRLPLALRAEGYGQAGAVARRGGFADGSLRLTHALIRHVDLGAGVWGAAQRQIARLDIGPTLGVTLPARASIRLTVEYRLRVAGRARPGSGPAVSIGSSF